MNKNWKIKPIIFIFISILLIGIGTTYAVFNNNYTFTNSFKSSTVDVKIEENFTPKPWNRDTKTTKEVKIANKGNSDVVIRISYDEVWSKELNGEKVQINNLVNGQNVVIKEWTSDFLKNFVLKDDGWYYYNKVLKGNSAVTILESIKLDYDLVDASSENYEEYDYELSFNFEAVQADAKAIKEVWKVDATLAGNSVTW